MAKILKSNFGLFFYLKSKSKKLESKGNHYLLENHIPNFDCLIFKKVKILFPLSPKYGHFFNFYKILPLNFSKLKKMIALY